MGIPVNEFSAGKLKVKVFHTRGELGAGAAHEVSTKIQSLLSDSEKEFVNIIFASAPSQVEFLEELKKEQIPWHRINAFHMDEYVGLSADAPQGFGNFLKAALFDDVPLHQAHYMDGNAQNPEEECERYAGLLEKYPVDIVCLGIGENTHLAFNDPHVADFNDKRIVKIVDLDRQCRNQQVFDGCFRAINEVPTHALTITIPALFRARHAYAIVPGERKAVAIYDTVSRPVGEIFPSTILRTHPDATLFLDVHSSSKL